MHDASHDQVIFLHMEKTGGTSLGVPLRLLYGYRKSMQVEQIYDGVPEQYLALSEQEKNRIRLLKGHVFYGIHDHCPGRSVYFTFLRDPVKRIDSFHRMLQREWPDMTVAAMSLDEYVNSQHPTYVCNAQVRRVAGMTSKDQDVNAEVFERAKDNLDRHFVLAGVTEQFDASLLLLKDRLGWTFPPFYVRSRVGSSHRKRELSAELATRIREQNIWDQRLYEHVRDRLDREIAREGPAFKTKVERFQSMNRTFETLAGPFLHTFRTLREWGKEHGLVHFR